MNLFIFAGLILSSFSVNAQNSSLVSIKDTVPNRKFEDSRKITDPKMRADSGSLSKYSLKFNMSYVGSSLVEPLAKDIPNPEGMVGSYATSLNGSMSLRFRRDSDSAWSLGTGVNALRPFHGMERFDMRTPSLSFDKASRYDDIQMMGIAALHVTTIPEYKKVGQAASTMLTFSWAKDLGASGFSTGMENYLSYSFYNRDYERTDGKIGRYNFAILPNVKYLFSDKYSINTSLCFAFWNPRSQSSEAVVWNKPMSQKLGFGYTPSRKIYVNPHISFRPDDARDDTTTVGIATIFSVL